MEYVFVPLAIIAYMIWSYDSIIDMASASRNDRSMHRSAVLWLIITVILIILTIMKI